MRSTKSTKRGLTTITAAIGAIVLVASMVGCSTDTGSDGGPGSPADGDSNTEPALLTTMKERGAILGGLDSPPTAYVNSDGSLGGYSFEVMMEVMSRMGVTKFEALMTDYPGMVPALQASRSDIVVAAMTPNEERCPVMTFTKPDHVLAFAFAVQKGNPLGLTSLADMKNKNAKLGTQGATTQERVAVEVMGSSDNIVVLPDRQSGIDALRTNRIDAFVAPMEALGALKKNNPDMFEITNVVSDLPILAQASAVRNADKDFAKLYDKYFDEMVADGSLKKLSDEYGFDYDLLSSPLLATCD